MMEQALYAKLSELDVKVYPLLAPIDCSFPVIAYQLIAGVEERGLTACKFCDKERFQIDIWSESYAEVKNIKDQVLQKLEELKAYEVLVRDDYEEKTNIYRQMIDFYLKKYK